MLSSANKYDGAPGGGYGTKSTTALGVTVQLGNYYLSCPRTTFQRNLKLFIVLNFNYFPKKKFFLSHLIDIHWNIFYFYLALIVYLFQSFFFFYLLEAYLINFYLIKTSKPFVKI